MAMDIHHIGGEIGQWSSYGRETIVWVLGQFAIGGIDGELGGTISVEHARMGVGIGA